MVSKVELRASKEGSRDSRVASRVGHKGARRVSKVAPKAEEGSREVQGSREGRKASKAGLRGALLDQFPFRTVELSKVALEARRADRKMRTLVVMQWAERVTPVVSRKACR